MKKVLTINILLIIALLTVSAQLFSNTDTRKKILTNAVLSSILNWHYEPGKINDEFSQKVFNLYIERLDYGKRFFIKSDIELLKKYMFQLDNQIRQADIEFYQVADTIITDREKAINELYEEILAQPFDYSIEETIETDYEKLDYCTTWEELKDRWRKILKYQTLQRYLDMVDSELKVNSENNDQETKLPQAQYLINGKMNAELELKARKKITDRMKNYFKRLEERSEDEKFSRYLNAVANVFDPHTSYFPPREKEDFDVRMSGKFEGIGAALIEDNGYIKVTEIIPGSASWRQKELQAEDLILKVAQGKDEPVEVVDMPVREVVKLIRGKKGTEVRLTVKKPTGDIKIIPITRDEVILEDTYAKAAKIKNRNKEYGYIYLPKFYRDFDDSESRNATDDLRKILKQFQKTDGLIFDLRDNGGGALPDAIDIAGLFIETGPIVQVKGKNYRGIQYNKVYKDNDPKVYYDSPVVVLVNRFSASASEILAAALQDYKRAIIIGSNQTYGKGTVQTFFDLDRYSRFRSDDGKSLGAIKITHQKFYRANGGSTQANGVESDIALPDIYAHLDVGEKDLEYSLPWDTIDMQQFDMWDEYAFDSDKIKERSLQRVATDDRFRMIEERTSHLKDRMAKSEKILSINEQIKEREMMKKDSDKMQDVLKENKSLIVNEVKYQKNNSALEDKEKLNEWYSDIKKDAYIGEALQILNDLKKGK